MTIIILWLILKTGLITAHSTEITGRIGFRNSRDSTGTRTKTALFDNIIDRVIELLLLLLIIYWFFST